MPTPFKEYVDEAAVRRLADALAPAASGFDADAFAAEAAAGLDALELKQRIDHVAAALGRHLDGDFDERGPAVAAAVERAQLGVWETWPVTLWAAAAGAHDVLGAAAVLARLTRFASGEMAIRPLIDAEPDRMRAVLEQWAHSGDEHVRRLASEGTRPRLPWAARLAVAESEPGWAIGLLDLLREDDSPDVRRSVANHLNDICKADPELALATARRWADGGGRHVDAVLRHGLRTLVKQGRPEALRLLGTDPDAAVEVQALSLDRDRLSVGETLTFACLLRSTAETPQRVVVDYVIHHARARGGTSPKVFKLRTLELAPGATVELSRRHAFRPVTVRRYYAGTHALELQVNGTVRARGEFELVVGEA